MKGLKRLKFISDLRRLIGPYKSERHHREYLRERLEKYFKELNKNDYEAFIAVAIQNHEVLGALNSLSVKSGIYIDRARQFTLPPELIIRAFNVFCKMKRRDFNLFYEYRNKIEVSIIKGKYKEALAFLQEVEKTFGNSLWAVDMRMNIYSRPQFVKESKEYLDNLSKFKDVAHISTLIHRKHSSTSLSSYYNQVLRNLLLEYRSNELHNYADFLSSFLLPEFIDDSINYDQLVIFSQRLTPIDKLMLMNRLSIKAAQSKHLSECVNFELLSFAKDVSKYFNQGGWSNIKAYSEGAISNRLSKTTHEAIKLYSSGRYGEAISMCSTLERETPLDMSWIDISARSIIHTNSEDLLGSYEGSSVNLNEQFLNALLIVLKDKTNFELAKELYELLFFKYLNFQFISTVKPLFYAVYPHKNIKKLRASCIELFCSDFQISPKYINLISNNYTKLEFEDTLVEKNLLTESRRMRADIELKITSGESNKDFLNKALEHLLKKQDILEAEYWSVWYRAKLHSNQFKDIVITVVGLLIESDDYQHYFPLKDIIERIERDRELYTSNVYAVILYYKYFRLRNFDSKQLMSEFLEDFLAEQNVSVPSELFDNWKELDATQEFFLKEVCNPEIMSILLSINSHEELLFERLKILQGIQKRNRDYEVIFAEEEFNIYEKLYIDILRLEHANNKIDIDVNGIKKAKFSEYQSNYELFSEFKDDIPDDLLALFESSTDEGALSKVENAILHFYGRLYDSILDDFIFNEDYGLVRYLSSEIRHGWLPNQIRSVLESHNLVTELGSNGEYERNEFWHETYELTVTKEFLQQMDEIFSWFSKEVDQLINTANGWCEVTRLASNRSVAFNVSYDVQTLKDFKDFTKSATSGEHFFELCTEFIWRKLDECFRVMRNLINKELKPDFNTLFEDLVKRIKGLGPDLAVINSTIAQAKNKTIDEISIIEGWFCRPSIQDIGKVELSDVIKVAISNTKGIYSPRELEVVTETNCFSINIDGNSMLSLIRALVTSLQNCVKYGTRSEDSDIKIKFESLEDKKYVVLENNISKDVFDRATAKNVVQKVENYDPLSERELLTTEGGTGLYKAFRFVKDYSIEADFKVELFEDKFKQVIKL